MKWLVAFLSVSAAAQVFHSIDHQQRDSRTLVGSAVVSGVVMTDEATPQPLRRAQVTLSSTDQPILKNVFTDAQGRFVVPELPAGRYSLSASKGGYVRMLYGARRHDRPGTPINLAEGQQLSGLSMRLPRGGVIAGRITDENGAPAGGVQVRLLQYRMQQGERTLLPALGGSMMAEATDDRGMYRLYGLPPGEYIVAATPRNVNVGEIRASTDAEIRAALAALQQPPTPAPPAGQQGQQLPPPKEHVTVGFAPVFFPGSANVTGASTVSLGPGEERSGVDFPLQLVRTAKIEGTVVVPAGMNPQSVTLTMVPSRGPHIGPGILGATFLNRVTPGPDGKFSYAAVPPGQYTINARLPAGAPGVSGRPLAAPVDVFEYRVGGSGGNQMIIGGPGGSGSSFWATTDVSIDGTPQSNVVLTLQAGLTVTGRIEFKGTRIEVPADLTRARITLAPAPTPGGTGLMVGVPSAQVDASGRFTISGVTPGRYLVNAFVPAPAAAGPGLAWTLQSAVFKGRDVLDFALEVAPSDEVSGGVLTFTDQTQQVSGTLQDQSGRPAPDYTIIVFAADKRYWGPQSRRIRTTRPGTDGRFTVANLPAGEYRLAAVVDIATGEANDPAFLEQLMQASVPIALAEGDRKVQDLRIAGLSNRPF
jgi:5-hydroxyisourate hydrolase-like protein (transthyretin family)